MLVSLWYCQFYVDFINFLNILNFPSFVSINCLIQKKGRKKAKTTELKRERGMRQRELEKEGNGKYQRKTIQREKV